MRRSERRRARYASDPDYRAQVIERAKEWNRRHKGEDVVYICKLYDADDNFKMIIGCFHKIADAKRYTQGNPRIKIERLPVV